MKTIFQVLGGFAIGAMVGYGLCKLKRRKEMESLREEAAAFVKLIKSGEDEDEALALELSEIFTLILKYTFDRLDYAGTGCISLSDFKERLEDDVFARVLIEEVNPTKSIDAVLDKIDSNSDGVITLGEYLMFFEHEDACYHMGCLSGIATDNNDQFVWGYNSVIGPKNWAKLSTQNFLATSGKEQSPINIISQHVIEGRKEPVKFLGNSPATGHINNNGHTVVVSFPDKGGSLRIGNKMYELAQFHFHSPSEHLLDGVRYPLELHFVHVSADNELAVVGCLFKIGTENKFVGEFQNILPTLKANGEGKVLELDLAPFGSDEFLQYNGSLTTPPCSEKISWNLVKDVKTISEEQLALLRSAMPKDNYRPVQPICNRKVYLNRL